MKATEAGAGGQPHRLYRLIDGAIDRLSTLPAIAGFWIVYSLLHAGLKLGRSGYLQYDDSLSAEVMQGRLLPAYQARNPPLYEWLLWVVTELFGPGIHSHVALRYVLITAIGMAMFVTVRAVTREPRIAAVASIGLLSFYWSAWHVHVALTQSLLLILLTLLTMRVMVAFCRRPDRATTLGFGVALGLGLLSKWSFALPAAAALIAALWDRETRRSVLGWPLLGVLVTALVLVAPTAFWLNRTGADVVGVAVNNLTQDQSSHALRVLEGLIRFFVSGVLLLLPWMLYVAAVFWGNQGRRVQPEKTEEELLVRRMAAANIALLICGIVAIGIVQISERYLYPLGLPLITAAYAAIARSDRSVAAQRLIFTASILTAVLVLALRCALLIGAMLPAKKTIRELVPYAGLAQTLEARGFGSAAFITPEHQLAGQIIANLPNAIAAAARTRRSYRPDTYDATRRCLMIWLQADKAMREEPVPAALADLLDPDLSPAAERLQINGATGGLGADRSSAWGLLDLGSDAAACHTVFGTAHAPR